MTLFQTMMRAQTVSSEIIHQLAALTMCQRESTDYHVSMILLILLETLHTTTITADTNHNNNNHHVHLSEVVSQIAELI